MAKSKAGHGVGRGFDFVLDLGWGIRTILFSRGRGYLNLSLFNVH